MAAQHHNHRHPNNINTTTDYVPPNTAVASTRMQSTTSVKQVAATQRLRINSVSSQMEGSLIPQAPPEHQHQHHLIAKNLQTEPREFMTSGGQDTMYATGSNAAMNTATAEAAVQSLAIDGRAL